MKNSLYTGFIVPQDCKSSGAGVFNITQNQHSNGEQNAIAVVQTLNKTENGEALKIIELLREENHFLKSIIDKLSSRDAQNIAL